MNLSRRSVVRARTLGAAVVLGAALTLSGCGFDAQTLQTYTPAHGVNVDDGTVKVRNLLIVADGAGQGILSGSFVSQADDQLSAVSGTALNPDGSDAGPLTVTGGPIALAPKSLTVLTAQATPFRVSSPALKPGLLARLRLSFGSGVSTTITVPVLDSNDPIYGTVAPQLSPSQTPAAAETPAATEAPATQTPAPAETPAG